MQINLHIIDYNEHINLNITSHFINITTTNF